MFNCSTHPHALKKQFFSSFWSWSTQKGICSCKRTQEREFLIIILNPHYWLKMSESLFYPDCTVRLGIHCKQCKNFTRRLKSMDIVYTNMLAEKDMEAFKRIVDFVILLLCILINDSIIISFCFFSEKMTPFITISRFWRLARHCMEIREWVNLCILTQVDTFEHYF